MLLTFRGVDCMRKPTVKPAKPKAAFDPKGILNPGRMYAGL